MKSKYSVISASAGSGKTYTLVQRLLMICLESPQQGTIREILALTFTNKAANEMKERILQWLGKFVADNYMECPELLGIQEEFKKTGKNIPIDELHRRAKNTLDYILHHYSTLNISTIDKFNSRLVRAFSYEFGLPQNFNLDIQSEPYLIEAVDKMLNQIGKNPKTSNSFMDYIEYNLDNEKRTDLSQELYQSAKKFINDVHYKRLVENKKFDWEAYESKKNALREEIRTLQKESLDIAKNTLTLIKSKDLDIEDFSGGRSNSIAKFFHEIIKFYQKERESFPLPKNEETALTTFEKGASAKSKQKESEIFDILNFLTTNRQIIIKNHILCHKKERILHSLLPLRVNKDIQDELTKIEEEKDLVLLSKFNILINENLRNEPSAFIYEKVGTRYKHYFFDEFQDTSALQWQNFVPLRDHTTTSEGTSFTLVGDPKQSIYRFRGGDSQLMLDIINQKDNAPVPAEKETLRDNYRSAKNIVDFNNQLYQYISQSLDEEHQIIFGKEAIQNPKSQKEGQVRVRVIANGKKEDFYNDVVEKMRNDIQQCLNNGFKLSDITILCRGNIDIFNYSQLLGNQKVSYQGEDIFIKTISEKGLTLNLSKTLNALIQLLHWIHNPKDKGALVRMLYYLNLSERIKINDFSAEIFEILKLENQQQIITFLQEKYQINLEHSHLPRLNLYNFVEHFVNEISVKDKEVDFILNFLEMLFAFTQHSGITLKDFLKYWEEEGQDIAIQASESVDAIQIMTIHKAKGLEFPIVLLPMENESKDKTKINDWYDLGENTTLQSVNIDGFSKELEAYDEEIAHFNQENIYKNTIDRLCTLYVATTRPVEQLFLYLEEGNKSANHLEILDFVQTKNATDQDFDLYEVEEASLKKQEKKQEKKHKTLAIPTLHNKNTSLANIKIATPSKNYQNRKEKVRIGIIIHDILAKINHKNDLEKVLEGQLLTGNITQAEREIIANKILGIFANEQYASYFADDLEKVLNEREILINHNGETELYRPDRIVKNQEGYIIIDFKTGQEDAKKHKQQLETYKNTLETLGKKVVETCVVYLD